jgi:hypothetical protein
MRIRPINGLSDPHWHVHCFIHNATFDPVEKRWKAGQFRGLIADKGYFQEYFHTLLARGLMKSGYKLRRTDRGWHQWVDDASGPGLGRGRRTTFRPISGPRSWVHYVPVESLDHTRRASVETRWRFVATEDGGAEDSLVRGRGGPGGEYFRCLAG